MSLTNTEYFALLRQSFMAFVMRCFLELNPQAKFLENWHIEVLAAMLDKCRRGETTRLIINVPPRHLKSLLASVALPAYLLGHNPTAQIICVSYGQDLADKFARDTRTIMASPWYRAAFSTRLSSIKQTVAEFVTTKLGFRFATSVGGVLTGRGADVIIIDDPLKPDDALSKAQRTAVNEWYDHTLFSRLNDKEKGCVIVVMQRLHEDDLIGHLMEQGGWTVLSFPAIAEKDETFIIETAMGRREYIRKSGDVLHPQRESRETLQAIRQRLGEYNFAGQYQQSPAPLGGGMVKVAWLKFYVPHELPSKFDRVVQSWDTANKATELSDYSACTTFGIKDKFIYVLDVMRQKLNYPELKRAVKEHCHHYAADVVVIEDRASGTQLIQDFQHEGLHAVQKYEPDGDKVMRMNSQLATIENGFVLLPKTASWLEEFLHEVTTFPNAKHDDQADSLAQGLDWIKKSAYAPGWGFLEFMRLEAEKAKGNIVDTVRIRVPNQSSHVILLSGLRVTVGEDRIIEVSEEDAEPLLRWGWKRA